jgi:PIN domain nuclease of toxin-antitoxin system
VNLLLDTHLMLWAMQGRAALPKSALPWMERADAVYVSAASLWEAAIKAALGKLDVDVASLEELLADAGFAQLPVRWAHAAQVALLPQAKHRDPFDRLLVAQAMSEPMHLLTCDAALRPYTDLVIVVPA